MCVVLGPCWSLVTAAGTQEHCSASIDTITHVIIAAFRGQGYAHARQLPDEDTDADRGSYTPEPVGEPTARPLPGSRASGMGRLVQAVDGQAAQGSVIVLRAMGAGCSGMIPYLCPYELRKHACPLPHPCIQSGVSADSGFICSCTGKGLHRVGTQEV